MVFPRRSTLHHIVFQRTLLFAILTLMASTLTGQDRGPAAARLGPAIDSIFALNMTPGMAVAVVRGDELVYAGYRGVADVDTQRPVDAGTRFYIASSTKALTAFAAALLDQRGALDLDDPLSKTLPDVALHEGLSPDSITLRDLLTHTHGIGGFGPVVFRTAFTGDFTPEQIRALLAIHRPDKNGRAFTYGNIGYNVGGWVLEVETGRDWKTVVRETVLEPAGMTRTTAHRSTLDDSDLAMPHEPTLEGFQRIYFSKGDANMHAAGGHLATAEDLARWLSLHLSGGRLDGRQVYSEAVVAETHRLQATQDRDFGPIHRFGWGLGWDLGTWKGDTLIHRFGSYSGFRSHMSFMPAADLGVVVLVNDGDLGSYLADMVAFLAYDLLRDTHDDAAFSASLAAYRERAAGAREQLAAERAERAARPQTLPHPLDAYTGAFANEMLGTMVFRRSGDGLTVAMGLQQSAVEVYDGEKNQLRVELTGGGGVVTFQFDPGGDRASGLTFGGFPFERVIP